MTFLLLPGIKALKYFEPPIVVEQFWIVLSKQNDIFEFRIFSHPLFSQPLNGINSPKKAFEKYNCELIFAVLRWFILIVMWIQPIFSFTELVTCNLMQICSWIFSKHFQNNFLSDICGRPLSYINFHILTNRRLEKGVLQSFTVQRKIPVSESYKTFKNTSGDCFFIFKISVPVAEFTIAVD